MSPRYQGELGNLWAAGGKQADFAGDERKYWYYKFCPGCGWKLTVIVVMASWDTKDMLRMKCPYCSGEIPVDVKFCPRCTAQQADFSELNN